MNYERMRQFLTDTVVANGELVSWQQTVSSSDGDKPWNGIAGASTTTNVKLMFVRAGSSAIDALLHYAAKDTDVPAHAVRAIFPYSAGFSPALTDVITRNGDDVFVIDSIDTIGSAAYVIGYIITFNRDGQ
jgi:hypothetical protein